MLVLGLVEVPWWGFLLIVIIAYLVYSSRDFNFFKKQGIPGRFPVPILGTGYIMFDGKDIATREIDQMKEYAHSGSKCYGFFMGSKASLYVYDEDILESIMVKDFQSFPNRMTFKSNDPSTDNMLISLKDSHWKYVRSEISPTFSTGKLKKMNTEVNRCAQTLTASLSEQALTSQTVEIKEYVGAYAMDVIASTAFGIRIESQKEKNNPFIEHARHVFNMKSTSILFLLILFFPELANLLLTLRFSINLWPKATRDFFANITKQSLKLRKEDPDQSRSDFLQLMIKAQEGEAIHDGDKSKGEAKASNRGLTHDEILANALIFFVAGYDTTATSLGYLMFNLACYPDIQDKVVEEINKVVGSKDAIEVSDLQEMPYLDMCVNENLRMYPPAHIVNRMCARDVTIKGIFFKKDMMVTIPIYGTHMDPLKWPEPEKFDPERFSPENKRNRHPFHFLPFGQGPRNCIGMRLALQELKVAAISVLRKIKVSTCEKTQIPIRFAKNKNLLKSEGGIYLKVEPRNPE